MPSATVLTFPGPPRAGMCDEDSELFCDPSSERIVAEINLLCMNLQLTSICHTLEAVLRDVAAEFARLDTTGAEDDRLKASRLVRDATRTLSETIALFGTRCGI